MSYDFNSQLWTDADRPHYWREKTFTPALQSGKYGVATCLAVLTGRTPDDFQGKINTQDPVSWSEALKPFGMKLAYCPVDIRKLRFYLDELVELDDLFLLCYYTESSPEILLGDPDEDGWICGSHMVILHRNQIIDTMIGTAVPAFEHHSMNHHTKRIFRVVPAGSPRGL